MEECLLVLIVTPSIENAVIDWLLERDDITGFTSMPTNGHGVSVHSMTIAEQVAGRQKQVMFQMHLPEPVARDILVAAQQTFSGSGMHYWLSPVLSAGRIE
ncbi:MAG TPA: DUF3240 domain-containing protein [Gammaproteobacteria bacterium]|nr:DUF3240 domain-containing protein [Gammaproteobacteria bacterium]